MCMFLKLGPDDTNASIITRLGELIEAGECRVLMPLCILLRAHGAGACSRVSAEVA